MTQKIRQYLHDFRIQIADGVAMMVASGSAPEQEWVKQAALRCEILNDVYALEADDLNKFYQPATEENTDAKTGNA